MAAPTRRRIEPGIYERVLPSGERLGLEIYFKDADGRPRRRGVKGDIHAARDELAQARTRRVRYELEPANPRMSLDAVIDRFEVVHAGARPNTSTHYRGAFKRIRPVLGHKRITAIGRADVRAFVGREVAEGLKANTVLAHYSALRKMFSFARDDLDIPVSFPRLKPSELPDPADDQREHRVLADDELARVLEACAPHVRLYFRMLAETGARASEGLGLAPERIGDGTIQIVHQLGRDGRPRPLKTRRSRRTIEVTRGLAAELRLAGDRERCFPLLAKRTVDHQWAMALDRAGLDGPRPTIHDLRHTHASRLIAENWDPVEIAKRLGDSVETVLRVYVHEFDARRRSAERRAMLEVLYGGLDGYQMATDTPSQAATGGAKVQRLPTHRDTV